MPGLLDLRVHNRVPGSGQSESIESLTRAAARGGFSSILAMPNTTPPADNPATIRFIQDRINQDSKINVYLSGCLTVESKGKRIAPLGSLKDEGVIAVTDFPASPVNNQIFANAIRYAKMFGLKIIDFPQDLFLSKDTHVHEGPLSLKMGLAGNPRIAEELSVQRSILMSKHLNVPIHLSSISSAGSITLIREAKQAGVQITADTSAHHLLLNENATKSYNTYAKVAPPLRSEVDRLALVSGIKDDTIDACNSSHSPFAEHLKNVEFDLSPSGATGLETTVPAFIESLSDEDPYPYVAIKMSEKPHKILGLDIPSLKSGSTANLTVIRTNEEWTYDPREGESQSSNSPLIGKKFNNKVILTTCNGRIAYAKK